MAKFKVSTKGNLITVTQKQLGKLNVNERELKVFEENLLPGFFRPKLVAGNKMLYTVPNSISLADYVKKDFSIHKLYSMLAQFSEIIKSIRSMGFYPHKLVLDSRLIYVKEITGEVFFLYTPLELSNTSCNIFAFLAEVIKSVQSNDINVMNECNKVQMFLEHPNHQDYGELEGFIMQMYPQIYQHITRRDSGQSGFISSTKLGHEQHYHPSMSFKNETEKTEKEESGTTLLEESGTTLLGEESGTTLLQEETVSAILIRRKTQETINVSKSIFRIGKLASECDYVITDNNVISKKHASIYRRECIYFVGDDGSKNHTYVNGVMLTNNEVELHNGDILKLANEEFEFYIN